ncbi:E3 ubiquitin-protein ligase ATL23-like [Magnolia sinica]|uniref:E3 ubiquitin-protein ligase ATL23-like n=1 Tax=Magnolia sinica TaxID=86752 RepID=UPI002658257C|nr:E3 ubiquitin-protein ligase ATL23-like [Magnolia sinica]XP_058112310.1 E3 ubiquitin-protein ligase ATL23-like [Magnolia sinica]
MSNSVLEIATQIMVMAIVISVVLLFVGIGVLVLIHVCIVGRAFRRGFNASNRGERAANDSSNGMSLDDLEKLPCFDFKARDKGSSPVDCAVCLENFKMGDKCRLLPVCNHSFHAHCVDSWLLKTPVCPICRAGAGSQDGFDVFSPNRLGGVGFELRESPAVVVGIPVSSNPSPLHASSLA